MRAWSWEGGAFVPCDGLPLSDRGFRYGMALFESLRVFQGRPLFLEEHVRILREACQQREFAVPEVAIRAIPGLFDQAGMEGFARIYVTAGEGGVLSPVAECRTLVLLEDRPWQTKVAARVSLSSDAHIPVFGGLKTANYWPHIDALQRAARRGFEETLLFNEHAELVSAAMANVFLVRGGVIRTPATACGARAGVLRGWIARREPVRECSLFLKDVLEAEEIFLTNSWIGILPIAEVEGRALPSQACATRLAASYQSEVLG